MVQVKKIVLFVSALIITIEVHAQYTPIPAGVKNAILENNSKTWFIKRLPANITLANGITVEVTGKVKMPNGKTYFLYNGDVIDFNGCFVGLKEVDTAIVKYHYRMWVCILLRQPMLFDNGMYALPNGIVEDKNGNYLKLKEGETFGLNSKAIINSSTFFVQNNP